MFKKLDNPVGALNSPSELMNDFVTHHWDTITSSESAAVLFFFDSYEMFKCAYVKNSEHDLINMFNSFAAIDVFFSENEEFAKDFNEASNVVVAFFNGSGAGQKFSDARLMYNTDMRLGLVEANNAFEKFDEILDVLFVDTFSKVWKSLGCERIECCPVLGTPIVFPVVDEVIEEEVGEAVSTEAELDPKDATILELTQKLQGVREDLRKANEMHQKDIDNISEALNQEADNRGWCNEYAEFLVDLNQLLYRELTLPEREYSVDVEFTETRTYTVTYSVTASDEDQAKELADSLADDDVYEIERGKIMNRDCDIEVEYSVQDAEEV